MKNAVVLSLLPLPLGLVLACGGGGGGGSTLPPPPPPPPPPIRDITVLAGKWRGNLCIPVAHGTSSRQQFDVTKTSDTTLTYTMGFAPFSGANCTGTIAEPPLKTPMGTISFQPTEKSGEVTFNRGRWVANTGLTTQVIWALRDDRTLYVFTDPGAPSMGTPDQVAAYVRVLSQDQGLVKP